MSSPTLRSEEAALEEALHELATTLLAETTTEVLAGTIASLAARSLPGCDAASVTVVHQGRPATAGSSATIAHEVDAAQYATREGPCLAAIDTMAMVRVDSVPDDDRWPGFAQQACASGVLSSLSVPLVVGDAVLGGLNLYSRRPSALANSERSASTFARQAAVTWWNHGALRRANERAQALGEALERRDTIGQAKGIIMAARDVSSDQAFEVLRRTSQASDTKLYDVAREIVERHGLRRRGAT